MVSVKELPMRVQSFAFPLTKRMFAKGITLDWDIQEGNKFVTSISNNGKNLDIELWLKSKNLEFSFSLTSDTGEKLPEFDTFEEAMKALFTQDSPDVKGSDQSQPKSNTKSGNDRKGTVMRN